MTPSRHVRRVQEGTRAWCRRTGRGIEERIDSRLLREAAKLPEAHDGLAAGVGLYSVAAMNSLKVA